jgi:hypothetical protein
LWVQVNTKVGTSPAPSNGQFNDFKSRNTKSVKNIGTKQIKTSIGRGGTSIVHQQAHGDEEGLNYYFDEEDSDSLESLRDSSSDRDPPRDDNSSHERFLSVFHEPGTLPRPSELKIAFSKLNFSDDDKRRTVEFFNIHDFNFHCLRNSDKEDVREHFTRKLIDEKILTSGKVFTLLNYIMVRTKFMYSAL